MKKLSGFTILELMAVVAVAGVLITVGIPSMQKFIKNNRLVTVHNELVSALQVARSAAIQKSGAACVCSSSTVSSATPVCGAGADWETGWIAFVDTNTNAVTTCVFEPADDDVLLKAWDGTKYAGTMTVRSNAANINANGFIRFNARGAPLSSTGVSLQGMFKVCDDRGMTDSGIVLGRGLILSASGSLRTTKDTTQILACL